jgi:hypothetical protein
MANGRKPIPKSQRKISEDLQTPLSTGGAGFQPIGNPNDNNILNNPNEQATGLEHNRALKYSFSGDTIKPFTVGIEDIDNAVFFYFQNVIQPYVIQNSQRIEVPVIYGSPERWKSVQKDGYYRDKLNKVMLPLIMIKRNDITKNRSIGNKLDANQPNLYVSFKKQYSPRNFYGNFAVLNNRIPETEYYANVVPDYVTVTYECMVMTYYMDQMNKIVEAINYASDSYWGDPSRFKFKAAIDSINTVTELSTDQDRVVRSTFQIKLNGYIIPDVVQKDASALKKLPSLSKVTFTMETEASSETFGISTKVQPMKKIAATFFDNVTVVNNGDTSGGGTSQEVLDYLALNNVKVGDSSTITNNGTISTVTFLNSSIETAPGTLPPTTVSQFSFYINGQYVEHSAITSFVNSGSNTILTVDNAALGFGLDITMEVVASGKFSN